MKCSGEKRIADSLPVSQNLILEVRKRVDEPLFAHIMSVAEESLRLAEIFKLSEQDTKRVCTAALLHDITKRLSLSEQLSIAEKYGVALSDDDLACPAVIHSVTGAEVARHEFAEYTDEAVCSAIRCHTMGSPGMAMIDKILFIADYIEPRRAHDICIKTREALYMMLDDPQMDRYAALDLTVRDILKNTISYLKAQNRTIHPMTLRTLESMGG